jgi:hypothetical protein
MPLSLARSTGPSQLCLGISRDRFHSGRTYLEKKECRRGKEMRAVTLGAALSEVDWYEIAEHYIADVDKEDN